MRIAVMSDTHGNIKLFQEMIDFAAEELRVKSFWHLGDSYDDCDRVDLRGRFIVRVPGTRDSGYRDHSVQTAVAIPFDPFKFLLVHDQNEARGILSAESNVILHGHTHKPECQLDQRGKLYICPGHLKARRDRSSDASFMVLTVHSGLLVVELYLSTMECESDRRFRVNGSKIEEL